MKIDSTRKLIFAILGMLIGFNLPEIFEFIKPNFFENYTSGSKTRHKITYQFEDTIHLETFNEDTKKFLQQLAKHIYLWREVGVEHDVETEIKKAIYQKAYVENLPIFISLN